MQTSACVWESRPLYFAVPRQAAQSGAKTLLAGPRKFVQRDYKNFQ